MKKIILFVLLLISLHANAQITFDDDVDDTGTSEPVPVNHFIGLLILAGLWYGHKNKKNKM
jgi:hypothetical protein